MEATSGKGPKTEFQLPDMQAPCTGMAHVMPWVVVRALDSSGAVRPMVCIVVRARSVELLEGSQAKSAGFASLAQEETLHLCSGSRAVIALV